MNEVPKDKLGRLVRCPSRSASAPCLIPHRIPGFGAFLPSQPLAGIPQSTCAPTRRNHSGPMRTRVVENDRQIAPFVVNMFSLLWTTLILCVLGGAIARPAAAPAGQVPYIVSGLEMKDSLPLEKVRAVRQTRDGYLWLPPPAASEGSTASPASCSPRLTLPDCQQPDRLPARRSRRFAVAGQ